MSKLKQLQTKKGRDESGLFIVEGEKFVAEIPENYKIHSYYVSQKYADTHDLSLLKKRARVDVLSDKLFNEAASTITPQGIIAVCEQMRRQASNILTFGGFVLLCEEFGDPGNTGTLIRTAAAAGAGCVILTKGSCELYNPKVIRSAAGAALRLPIVQEADINEVFRTLKESRISIYAAHPRGDILPYKLDLKKDFCLMIGNEARGLSKTAINNADVLIRLPMANDTESLNASAAGSILLYEAVRQRQDFM